MTTPSTTKTMARLEARISPEIKSLLQKAADLEGLTLTDFAIVSLQKAAIATIQKHQTLKLSLEDSEAFVDALLNPPFTQSSTLGGGKVSANHEGLMVLKMG